MKLADRRSFVPGGFVLVWLVACRVAFAEPPPSSWPSLEDQLAQDHVVPGTALDRLVRDNQDFGVLDPKEASDTLGLPPWLRLVWRTGNPGWRYRRTDPTGGYPHVLKEVRAWMRAHQDLAAAPAEPGFCAVTGTKATIPQGANIADFLLVVPNNGSNEGSYGTSSTGARRPAAASACLPAGAIAACAP